jgi:type IV secretion system protein VirD4
MAEAANLGEARTITEGIYLGLDDGNEYPPLKLAYKGPKHLLSFGPPGSGKSTSLCAVNLARRRRSIICFDPKGQFAAITARRRREMGTVYTLDPFNLLPQIAPTRDDVWRETRLHWNPLAQLGRNPKSPAFIKGARAIAQAMIDREGGGGNSKFFDDSMEIMLTALCMWEVLQKKNAPSLRNIREELASDTLLATFEAMSKSEIYAVRIAGRAAHKRMTDKTGQTTSLQDVIATALKNTGFLDDDTLADDMFEGKGINFARLHEEITTIYVVLPVSELIDQAKWLRMFINLAMKTLLRAAPKVAKLPPVLFMLDEFGNIGRLPEILNVLNISRDLRLQMWFFLQSVGQLKASYEKEWTYFFAGAGARTTFAAYDPETMKLFSELLGKTESEIKSYTQSGGHMFLGYLDPRRVALSETRSRHIHQLIEPEDMARLHPNQTINLIEPEPMPVRGLTPGYWKLPFAHELDANPYYHG